MKNRKNRVHGASGDRILTAFIDAVMVLTCIVVLFPLLNVISVSLSDSKYIYMGAVSFYPRGLNFDAYKKVLESSALWRSFLNSLIVAVGGCFSGLLMTAFAAYPLAFKEFAGKKLVTTMILLTMWFGGGIIPTFMVMNQLHLIDHLSVLILGSLISAYNMIIMRSFFKSIPSAMLESAQIDGANDFTMLFRIVLPVSKAVLATIGLWIIVGHWNDFMGPVIYMRSQDHYTVQVVLRDIVLSASASEYGLGAEGGAAQLLPEQMRNATIVVTMIPILAVYPFIQKYFVKGVMIGSVKG